MSLKRTIQFIDAPNVAALIEDDKDLLDKIGKQVCEDYAKDYESMAEWREGVEEGRKVAKVESKPKSYPWEGASNYKSPIIQEAIIQFGDRASSEILTSKNLVKPSVENDVPEVVARKTRIAKFMNWQFNFEMEDWRDKQESLFYEVAGVGVVFKKTFFDPSEGRNQSEPIHYPNFAVNNDDLDAAKNRFSITKNYSQNEIESLQRAEIWLEIETDDEDAEAEEDEEKSELLTDDYIEQWTTYDIDGDGYDEPYIITCHRSSSKVVRIVARYDQENIMVKAGPGMVQKLSRVAAERQQQVLQQIALEKQAELQAEMQDAQASGEGLEEIDPQSFLQEMQDEVQERIYDGIRIIKITPTNEVVKYGFIPDPEGRYLNWGYCHLLRSYAALINTLTNQTIDAGTLANVPGGFIPNEFRNNKSPIRYQPGKFTQVNVPASVLNNGLKTNVFAGPNPGLMQLMQMVEAKAQGLAATVNLQDAIAPNAPAATTLGILQEKLIPTTTIIRRIVRSMSKEFRLMGVLNYLYTDPITYRQVVDDEAADYKADFENYTHDIELTANAAMTSQVQRMQGASIMMEQLPIIMQTGGDARPIIQDLFGGIGKEELFAKVYPDPSAMTPEQKAQFEQQQQLQQQMLQQQQISNQLAQQTLAEKQFNNQLKSREIDIKQAEQQRKQAETMAKLQREGIELQLQVQSQQVDAAEAQARIQEIMAQANLHYAKADTDILRAQADSLRSQLDFTQRSIGAMQNA